MSEYGEIHTEIVCHNNKVIDILWDCNYGFGHLVIATDTHEIIDDEGMSNKFCLEVIKIALE